MARATAREVLDIYPLTPAQQGILAETLGSQDQAHYLQHHTLEITGVADPAILHAALADLIARHDVLRTGFVWEVTDQPLQVLRGSISPRLTVEDLRGAGAEVISGREARLLAEERATPFDLGHPPLLRVRALRTHEARWRLIVTHHHLILDGWSVSLLHAELAGLLAAHSGAARAALPPPRPFREFVAWQRAARDPGADEAYFRELLAGATAGTALGDGLPPSDCPAHGAAPPVTVFRPAAGEAHPARVARRAGVLPATLVHAAWALVLARWSGSEDVVFGTTVSGRPAELDDAGQRIGMFLNTTVLRIAVPGQSPAGEWLREVQRRLDRLRQHEHAPASLASRCSAAAPGTSLLTSVLAFQNYWRPGHEDIAVAVDGTGPDGTGRSGTGPDGSGPDGAIRMRVAFRSEQPGVPVTVAVALPDEGAWVRIGYDPARVTAVAAHAAADALADVLAGFGSLDASTRLADIPVADGTAPGPRDEPDAAGLLRAIEARLTGDAMAPVVIGPAYRGGDDGPQPPPRASSPRRDPGDGLCDPGDDAGVTLTAGALRSAAIQTAARLRQVLGQEETAPAVAVCAPPGPALVVGLLAALACGSFPVPVDPCRPGPELADRLAGLPVLVPEETGLAASPGGPVVRIETDGSGPADGSSRRSALAFGARLVRDALDLAASDTVFAVLAAEDPVLPSVVLAALSAGCRLVLRDPFAVTGLPASELPASGLPGRPTVLVAAGPTADRLAGHTAPGARVVLAGEPPAPGMVRRVLAGGRSAWRLWASERTGGADACAGLRHPEDALMLGAVPGGMVADDSQAPAPAPPGVAGELVINRHRGPCRTGIRVRGVSRSAGQGQALRPPAGAALVEQLGRTRSDELALTGHLLGLSAGVAAAAVTADADGRPHAWLVPADAGSASAARATETVAGLLPARARLAGRTMLPALPVGRDGGTNTAALTEALLPPRRPTPPAGPDRIAARLAALPPRTREAFTGRLRSLAARTPGMRPGAATVQARSQQQEEWHAQALPARATVRLVLPSQDAPDGAALARALAALRLPPTAARLTAANAADAVTLNGDPQWLDATSLATVAEIARTGQDAPPFRYADYTAWQNSSGRVRAAQEHAAFWQSALDGVEPTRWPVPPPNSLPDGQPGTAGPDAGQPAPAARAEPSAAETVPLTAAEAPIAAAATALAFLADVGEVVVGVVTQPELPAETAGVPGAYARTLPLRVTVRSGQSFASITDEVSAALRDARAHGDVPWAVLDELVPRPLALSVAVHQVPGALAAHGSAAIGLDIAPAVDGSPADGQVGGGAVLTAVWRPELAHAEDVRRLLELTAAVLRHGTTAAGCPLQAADLTGETASAALLRLGTGASDDPTRPFSITGAILDRCAAAPEAAAMDAPDGVLSYAGLAARARALADTLTSLGVGSEDRVAVCVPRTTAMAWAPLGVMIAGAAYVPLDSEHPDERLRTVLTDAGAQVVVTTGELAARFPPGLRVIATDTGDGPQESGTHPARHEPADARPILRHPRAAAYVLYTSGSTGTPKGVVVEQGAVASFCTHIARAYHIGPGTRLLAFAAPTFDVSVFELWSGLAAGATVVLAGTAERQSPQALQQLLERKRVTTAELPPSLMPLLDPRRLPHLRLVSVGGEAPAGALVDDWASPEREFWNGYGPTETTVAVTLMRCLPPSGGRVPPIGLPMPGHRAYVLDQASRLVPPGVPGELCVAGPGLARGYLGLPGATAASFVPDPHQEAGARMYRTGDRVRWTAAGVLEFLGRIDRQIKIRGFRVEPAEVEAALARHPGVRQVSVQPWDAPDGARHLAAYVVPAPGAEPPSLAGLRAAAAGLPGYMLPTRMAVLASLPLTPVGKVDTGALPEPHADSTAADDASGWSQTERVIAREVIGPLIGSELPSRDGGFFELGGDSLQAAQVTARVRDRFGVEISLVDFFREPTIAALARLIDGARIALDRPPARPQEIPADAGSRAAYVMTDGASLPLSYPQAMLHAAYRATGDLPGYHAPLALRLRGPLNLDALRSAFGWLAARHATLRVTVDDGPGWPVQLVRPAAEPSFEVTDVPQADPEVRDQLLRRAVGAAAAEPFDLASGPLLRARVHRLGTSDHVVQWTIHHLATDGWSTGVQLHELGVAYHALAAGREPSLPPLRADYGEFVSWHREYVASAAFRDDLAWWRGHLAGLPANLRPVGRGGRPPDAAGVPFVHGWRNLRLSDQTAAAAKNFARAHDVTLFMTCMGVQAIMMAAETGSDDVLIVTPRALRVRSAWEELVGWFANPVPIRVRLSARLTFAALAAQVRRACMDALGHGNVPFELLRAELGLGRQAIACQFSLMNAPGRAVGFRGFDIDVAADDSGRDFTPVLEVYSPPGIRYQLSIVLRERLGGIIAGGLEYDASVTGEETADRWQAAFLTILHAATTAPGTDVAELIRMAGGAQ